MEIQRNRANVIRTLKEASGKSLSEFSEELEDEAGMSEEEYVIKKVLDAAEEKVKEQEDEISGSDN